MKHALFLLGLLAALTAPAGARPRPRPAAPAAGGQRVRYLTEALQLSGPQARTLRRCLAGPGAAATFAATRQLDQALLRILTPGQYNAFVWLRETAPR